jgi:hypothetical protein
MNNKNESNDTLQTINPVAAKRRRFIRQTAAAATLAVLPASLQSLAGNAAGAAMPAKGYAANNSTGILSPWDFKRRAVGADDVQIEILFCGVCNSDIHTTWALWSIPG